MNMQSPSTLSLSERIERALVLLAYFIELDGDVHLAMFEKFEAELAELRRAETARSSTPSARQLQPGWWPEGNRFQKLKFKFKRRSVAISRFA